MPHFSQRPERLLSRNEFQVSVSRRDKGLCVHCGNPGLDAHHLIDRSLFDDGGYYLSQGVFVCSKCHLLAESTVLDCRELRAAAGITNIILPDHFESDERYDKWGNPFQGPARLRGEMFWNEGVQRLLEEAGLLGDFISRVKYPRTMHLPSSPNLQNDDRRISTLRHLKGAEVVVTEKRDGENTTMYPDAIHARSLDSLHHPSRSWVKQLHGMIAHDIPVGMRICGENLFALHSVPYDGLETYFEVFNVWTERHECLSWDETVEWAAILGLKTVPVLYRGGFDESVIEDLAGRMDLDRCEGLVVRVADSYLMRQHRTHSAKWVRAKHVQTSTHWMEGPVVKNGLRS